FLGAIRRNCGSGRPDLAASCPAAAGLITIGFARGGVNPPERTDPMKKQRLFTPGPCEAPAEVLLELAKPIFHHRTDEFRELFKRVRADMKTLFQTDDDVVALTSSGT